MISRGELLETGAEIHLHLKQRLRRSDLDTCDLCRHQREIRREKEYLFAVAGRSLITVDSPAARRRRGAIASGLGTLATAKPP